jgi:hypothetical protein
MLLQGPTPANPQQGWLFYTQGLIVCLALLSWRALVVAQIRVAPEIRRVRRADEMDIPASGRGLPISITFTKGILPRVEIFRRISVRAMGSFLACIAVGGYPRQHIWACKYKVSEKEPPRSERLFSQF